MTIPDAWRGPYSPRDPLTDPTPRNPFPDPPQNIDAPTEQTARRVERERGALQDALAQLGARPQGDAR